MPPAMINFSLLQNPYFSKTSTRIKLWAKHFSHGNNKIHIIQIELVIVLSKEQKKNQ